MEISEHPIDRQQGQQDHQLARAQRIYQQVSKMAPYLPPLFESFYIQLLSGINDSNLGIILPSIKAHYGLTQYVVSIIFLCNTFGYVVAACTNGYMVKRFSQYKTAWLGSFSMLLGYLVVLFAVPFPVMCVFMVFVGYGIGLTQSSSNVVCGEMPRGTLMLCLLHAFYAAGGLIGPLMASGLLQANKPWNTSYQILCGLAGLNCISIFLCFRKLRIRAEREADAAEQEAMLQQSSPEEPRSGATSATLTIDEEKQEVTKKHSENILWQTIRHRINYVGAVFLLFYTGTEVTIGNWGYTFLISARSSDTVAMAHIMSGYWAGICAGRLFLGVVTHHFGEKRMIYCYLSIIVGMMVLLWLVPYVGANATALVVTGIALGPLFPTTVSVANKLIPTDLYASSVGVLSAFGSGGSALFPYITGVLIGSLGVQAMLPFCVATSSFMLIAWFFIPDPNHHQRTPKQIMNAIAQRLPVKGKK